MISKKARAVAGFLAFVCLAMPLALADAMASEVVQPLSVVDGLFFGVMMAVYPIGGYFFLFAAIRGEIPKEV